MNHENKIKDESNLNNKNSNSIFMLVFSALCLALSLMLKAFNMFMPVGIPILRIGFNGPPLKIVGVLFGPLYGGLAAGLSDFLGYVLMDKSGNFYLYQLTITAILSGIGVGLLWRYFKTKTMRTVQLQYLGAMAVLLVYGIVSFGLTYGRPEAAKQVGGSIVIIVSGLVGVILYFINSAIVRRQKMKRFGEYFFQMFLAVTIPGLVFNWVNTYILMEIFFKDKNKDMFLFGLMRSAVQLLESYYNVFVVLFIVILLEPFLVKKGLPPFGRTEEKRKANKEGESEL
ncbi:hypothetical protein C3V36_14310 [Lachnospiraceae bacterium oral taxon 500]|nr:hypothetical protein C3V36_14310 [Lachnospiraceae bacterium oral taxon 500]